MEWTSPEWACPNFPVSFEGQEDVSIEAILADMNDLLDTVTEADTSARSKVLHVAHILVTLQEADGHWAAMRNLRTGEPIGTARTNVPVAVFMRLGKMLQSSEFDHAIERANSSTITTMSRISL